MRSALAPELRLSDQSRDVLGASARAARTREQGGILVGYCTPAGLYIEDALVVDDESATHARYLRRSTKAESILSAYLEAQTDDLIGYVGEWHTHPLPVPPSGTDLASMRIMALRNSQQTGLIVVALERDLRGVTFYAFASDSRSVTSRLLGRYQQAVVSFES